MCPGSDDSNANVANKPSESTLPSIDSLQPLSIQLEQSTNSTLTTPSTSASGNENVSEHIDDVEKILKAIKNEFKEQDGAGIDGDNADNDVINVYSSDEEDGA